MSAIFGERLTYRDEHGDTVELRVWGDEFYARRETLSGYTVVYDTALGRYCYAQLVSGFFTSTGVPISKPPPPGLPRHLSEWPAVRRRRTAVRTRALTPPSLTAADDVLLTLGPAGGLLRGRRVSSGLVRGLTILVTFPDQTTTVTGSHVDALLNREDYNLDGNRGSVRDFWLAMSNAKLDYRNDVVGPYTLARPMSEYFVPEDTPSPASQILREATDLALADGVDLSLYDSRGEGIVDALSIMYAGQTIYQMPFWPHNSVFERTFPGGVRSFFYTITSMGRSRSELSIGTFCHEAGHLLCRFPDLYDYGERDGDLEDSSGLGRYCVMSSGNHVGDGRKPAALCAYLRELAGWPDTVVSLNGGGTFEAVHGDYARVLKYETPRPNEYFLVENRSQLRADALLPDGGLAVYHCDTLGSNELQAGTASKHYQCTLLQADGRRDLEHGTNTGDAGDLYPARVGIVLSDTSNPTSRRWDGADSGLVIADISAPGERITFRTGATPVPPTPPATGTTAAESTASLLIPDAPAGPVESVLELSGAGTIADIRVTVDLLHTFIGDLSIVVRPPTGAPVTLHNRTGGDRDDLRTAWTPAGLPALRDLVGRPFAGRWTLVVTDHERRDEGRLNRWRIDVEPAPAGGVVQVAGAVPAGGLAIPDDDPVGVSSSVTVADAGTVKRVAVTAEIRHPFIGDLVVELATPANATAVLHNNAGGNRRDLVRTWEAATTPALAALAGSRAAGTWTLRVRDTAPVDVGRLVAWSLRLETQ